MSQCKAIFLAHTDLFERAVFLEPRSCPEGFWDWLFSAVASLPTPARGRYTLFTAMVTFYLFSVVTDCGRDLLLL